MKAKYIPNILSGFRLALVPVFAVIFFNDDIDGNMHIALFFFLLAGLTDVIDGYLARRNNWVTNLGKFLDPLADKLMQCTVLVCLVIREMVPAWYAAPFILKEFLMLTGGLFILQNRKVVVVSNVFGKLAAFVFYSVIFIVMIFGKEIGPMWTNIVCAFSLTTTVSALIIYMIKYLTVPSNVGEGNGKTPKGA